MFVTQHINWPVARYAAGAIVSTATFLCWGLTEIVPRTLRKESAWLGLLGMIALDAIALCTVILPYYYGQWARNSVPISHLRCTANQAGQDLPGSIICWSPLAAQAHT